MTDEEYGVLLWFFLIVMKDVDAAKIITALHTKAKLEAKKNEKH